MSQGAESLTFATQGGEYSYHAVAARQIAGEISIDIEVHREFGEVVKASRRQYPGLGVIAICTAAGTVDASAREIVRKRPSALPPIVGRVDLPIKLALMGAREQSIEELNRHGVKCLAQKPAWEQCADYFKTHLPWIKKQFRGESTIAVQEVVDRDDPNYVAVGPNFAAQALGAVIIGPAHINPPDSVTSFYVLQRDPRQQILPDDPSKSEYRSIITIAHPEGEGEFEKAMELAAQMKINIARFIPFDIGDFTKHNRSLRRGGGLLEVGHDIYDEQLTEYVARIHGLVANDGVSGPFDSQKLGAYRWYPEPYLDPQAVSGRTLAGHEVPDRTLL